VLVTGDEPADAEQPGREAGGGVISLELDRRVSGLEIDGGVSGLEIAGGISCLEIDGGVSGFENRWRS
jgi:hypothetical protein